MKECFFIANNNIGDTGLSGGDRIFIELARGWRDKVKLTLIGTEEAINVSKREGLKDITFMQTSRKLKFENLFTLNALAVNFAKKLTNGISFIVKNRRLFRGRPYIYSVSDFYPDSIPAFLVKFTNPAVTWIAAFYLFAPAPWQADTPYRGRDLFRGVLYWLSQKPVYHLINRYADMVFVTSEPDRARFITEKRGPQKVLAARGGVDIEESTRYLNSQDRIPFEQRKYDGCFVGRFHPQKGVLELMDIWREVVRFRPGARLAMVGNGPLENEVKKRAKEYGIADRVQLFGFLNGEKKYEIFKQSRVVVHPATFDSGGMAAAEAMGWGLPGVGFDLESLKTYYPKGMMKARPGDYREFARDIIKLLSDKDYYARMSREARELIVEEWDWSRRTGILFNQIFGG